MTEKEYLKIINKLVKLIGYAMGTTSGVVSERTNLVGDIARLNNYLSTEIELIMDQLNEDD